ncbi:MAG: hypothetical protein KGY67_00460 [Candidatus Thermoplasmatota archaeon]|nr:hypothetical protein [Candidatus Thermoplasmatota archaeon]
MSLQLYSRGESKKYMENLFDDIQYGRINNAKNNAEKLKNCLLKYYITRNVDCDIIYEKFHRFNFLLSNCNNKNTLFNYLKEIRNISQLSISNPIMHLQQLYEDLRHDYLHVRSGTVETMIDIFDEIRSLKPKIQEYKDTSYNYFTLVLQDVGECESVLTNLTMQKRKIPNDKTMKELIASFQKLFKDIQKVIAPPVIINLSPAELRKQMKHKSLEEISEATGNREEELQAMLNTVEME